MDADYKLIIVGLLLLAALPAVVLGARGLKWGVIVWIATFALGYRTLRIAPQLLIHPIEVVLYGLCLWIAIQRLSKRDSGQSPWIPLWIWPFALAWIWAWFPIVSGDVNWATMLTEFKNVFLILPIFIVLSLVVKTESTWRPIILAFYCAGIWIAGCGIVEYLFPGIKNWLPNFISNPAYAKEGGFERAAFAFWGSPDAVYVCLLALPFSLWVWQLRKGLVSRAATAVGAFLLLYAIYISGHRNAWFIVALQLSFILVLKKRYYLLAVFVLAFVPLAYQRLPDSARTRFYSGAQLIAGRPIQDDSSGQGRWERVIASWNRLNDRPLGGGWAAGSWVHNDFLQLAENLGAPAGLLLLGIYLWTFGRMLKQVLARSIIDESQWLLPAMFLSHFAAGVIFATDANLQLTQHIAPIWFVWAASQILLKQIRSKELSISDEYSRLSAPAYFQLRESGAGYLGVR